MTYKRTVILRDDATCAQAVKYINEAPRPSVMRIRPEGKNRDQEERYHAMIGDIAKQVKFMGRLWDQDDMKRLLVDAFAEAMRQAGTPLHHDGRVVPSIDGRRIVQLGIQTSAFYKKEASEFIEYLFAYGAENNVVWSEGAK